MICENTKFSRVEVENRCSADRGGRDLIHAEIDCTGIGG